MASYSNASYKTVIVVPNGTKYEVQNITVSLNISQEEKGIAKKVQLELKNIDISGKNLNDLISVKSRAYVYYDMGTGWKECFRGYVWTKKRKKTDEDTFSLTCYDRGIYLQQSKDSFYFAKGKKTKTVIGSICKSWGITCHFEFSEIKHPKLAIRSQHISDAIIDILEEVRKQTGKRYAIYFMQDHLYIHHVGTNKTIYHIKEKENAIGAAVEETMEDMVTKVVIRGSQNKNGKTPIVATVKGDTSTYGTLQDEISKDKDTSLKEAKKEANYILKEKGKPFINRAFQAVDNPDVVKGQKIEIDIDGFSGQVIVKSVDHDAMNKTMELEVYQ